jgi:hypothetical protein
VSAQPSAPLKQPTREMKPNTCETDAAEFNPIPASRVRVVLRLVALGCASELECGVSISYGMRSLSKRKGLVVKGT